LVMEKIRAWAGIKTEEDQEEPVMTLEETIEAAKKDWQDAKKMFDEVADKDSVDALIHRINAYERQYIYLLKIAREEGITAFPDIT